MSSAPSTSTPQAPSWLSQAQFAVLNYPFVLPCLIVVVYLLRNKFQSGLAQIPGPTLAAYTNFWRFFGVYRGRAHFDAIDLHKRYGKVVRIGPNHVSVSDPAFIPVFYGTKDDYTKSAFYPIQSISWKKQPAMNLFSTRDPMYHRVEKRKVGHAYSLPSLLQSEQAIDSCIKLFMDRMGELCTKGQVDLGVWLQNFAFDVVGEVTFATKLGFLDQGKDVDGMMKAIEGMLTYASLCGQVPDMHPLLLGNPLFTKLMPAMETWNQVLVFTLKAINERASIKRDGELIKADREGHDMLSRWAYVKSSDPLKMNTRDIMVHLTTNVFAGSDTTAIALRAVVYFLCKNPRCLRTLVNQIDQAEMAGKLSSPISYKEATTLLPYLNAVLKESIRLHSSVGLLMERHVPAGGVEIDGYFLKGGVVVGINPWVTNHNEQIFPKADEFRPERWLESSETQLKEMDASWELNFGGGARKCIGRNMSWVEMQKVIPELLRHFHVELSYPDREWNVVNHWFTQQEGVICNLAKRVKAV